jgi:hypothetical protein
MVSPKLKPLVPKFLAPSFVITPRLDALDAPVNANEYPVVVRQAFVKTAYL